MLLGWAEAEPARAQSKVDQPEIQVLSVRPGASEGLVRVRFALQGPAFTAPILHLYEKSGRPVTRNQSVSNASPLRWVDFDEGLGDAQRSESSGIGWIESKHPARLLRRHDSISLWEAELPERAVASANTRLLLKAAADGAEDRFVALHVPRSALAPPTVTDVTITPAVINTSDSDHLVTISATFKETNLGLALVYYFLDHPDEESSLFGIGQLTAGTNKDGTWTSELYVPQFSTTGTYELSIATFANETFEMSELTTDKTLVITGEGDSNGPVVVGTPTITPASVDLSDGPKSVTITARLTDDVSGALLVLFDFVKDNVTVSGTIGQLIQGDAFDGTWQGQASIPENTEEGAWQLRVEAYDNAFNISTTITEATLQVGGGDVTAPELVGIPTVQPTAVNLSGGEVLVTVTARVRDAGTGVRNVGFDFYPESESGGYGTGAERIAGDSLDGTWRGQVRFPQNADPGAYALEIHVSDFAGNYADLTTGMTINVTGGDTEAPVAAGNATLAPGSIDLSEGPRTVRAAIPLRDPGSGVSSVAMELEMLDGEGTAGYTWADLVSGSAQEGTWAADLIVSQGTHPGRYRLVVDAVDVAGNSRTIVTNAELVVTISPPGPVSNPVPEDGASGVVERAVLAWSPAPRATSYDLFLWPASEQQPGEPSASGIFSPRYLTPSLLENTSYRWSVVARNGAGVSEGPVWSFTTRTLPDLVVSAVQAPPDALAGQTIEVRWTVTNTGQTATSTPAWNDVLYLSSDQTLETQLDHLLGNFPNLSYLNPGESYQNVQQITLPQRRFGPLFVLVDTDFTNQVAESNEENNLRAEPIQVNLPPTPDLQIATLLVPAESFSGQDLVVQWQVTNGGTGPTYSGGWRDRVFLTKDPELDPKNVLVQRESPRVQPALQPGTGYTATEAITLPDNLSGTLYVFVQLDVFDHEFEPGGGEQNNLGRATTQVTLGPPPDLVPTLITGPGAGDSGRPYEVTYQIENQGLSRTRRGWSDRLYLSPSATLDPATAKVVGTFNSVNALDPDSSYTVTRLIPLPDGISGAHRLFVVTDWQDAVFEGPFEGNNTLAAGLPIQLTLSPWPDLRVSTVDVIGTRRAGETVTVSWRAVNAGAGVAEGAWRDSVYISAEAPFIRSKARVIGFAAYNQPVAPGGSYTQTARLTLPADLDGGQVVFVHADAGRTLYEHTDEENNIGRSANETFAPYPPVDLAVTNIQAPTAMASGQTVQVEMTVSNLGQGRVLTPVWEEHVYLSRDNQLSLQQDQRLATFVTQQPLGPGESATRRLSFRLPHGIEGSYYLLGVTDATEFVSDADRTNNVRAFGPITVGSVPPADLRVASIDAPSTLTAGQPVVLRWTVRNDGPGAAADTLWYDAVGLSQTGDPSSAVSLGTFARRGAVAANATYVQEAEVTLPLFSTGRHYVVVRTDVRGTVYEADQRQNNTLVIPVDVVLPPPSDLVVTEVDVPDEAVVGEDVTVTWTLRNQGAHPASGRMTSGVYVSEDDRWNVEDPLVGLETRDISLAPGESAEVSSKVDLSSPLQVDAAGNVTGRLPGVTPGSYFALVRADLRNTIPESDELNNTTASTRKVAADMSLLSIGQPLTVPWASRQNHFYRVNPGAGVDLRVRLSRSAPFAGGLYVSAGQVPSQSLYDFADATLDGAVKEVVVPSTEDGPYYVLLRSDQMPTAGESFTVLAEALNFSVESIHPRKGGQGIVTTRIRGAGFRPNSRVFLRNGSGDVAEARVLAVPSTVELIARWDLSVIPLGVYTITVRNEGASADLVNGFEVEPRRTPTLDVVQNVPDALLVDRPATYILQFRNTSNVDIAHAAVTLTLPATATVEVDTDGRMLTLSMLGRAAGLDTEQPDTIDGSEYRFVPLVAKHVTVDEKMEIRVSVTPAGGTATQFPLRVDTQMQDRKTFLTAQLQRIEAGRQSVLTNADQVDPGWVALAQDRTGFAEYLLTGYVRSGLLEEEDVATAFILLDGAGKSGMDSGLDGLGAGVGGSLFSSGANHCERLFDLLGCPIAVADCFIKIPVTAGVAAGLCAFSVGTACTGIDVGPLGCIGVLTAINCIAKRLICKRLVFSLDPNDILGPEGFGDRRWVSVTQNLAYTIRFENDPELATAPAQVVRINLPIDPELDERSFRLGSFGFGGFRFDVPSNAPTHTARLDLRDSLGIYVDVNAGIDVQTRQAFWVLRSVDPATGAQPTNPFSGFLAINDSLGRGEGFVTYSIRPRSTAVTGDVVEAEARIFFDLNEPIDTDPVFNTIDAGRPQSQIAGVVALPDGNSIELWWSAGDDPGGSGIRDYALFAARDNEPFRLIRSGITDANIVLPREASNLYRFYVLATDNAGNVEAPKQSGEIIVSAEPTGSEIPESFELGKNYPNPFNPSTMIPFALPRPGEVELTVYDLLGRRVERLDLGRLTAGRYEQRLDLSRFASGMYLYELRVEDQRTVQFRATGKLLLVR